MIVFGADVHKSSHTIAAVYATTGEALGDKTIRVGAKGFGELLRWARSTSLKAASDAARAASQPVRLAVKSSNRRGKAPPYSEGRLVGDEPELSAFAQFLIRRVRDRAIRSCDDLLGGEVGGPFAERWREIVRSDALNEAVRAVTPDIVDRTLFELLEALDNEELSLAVRSGSTYTPLEQIGKGEMAGWLLGSPGWRHEYSAERFFDPFDDLRLE